MYVVDERWGESLKRNFREKKKDFWKEVNAEKRVTIKWRCESRIWMGIC